MNAKYPKSWYQVFECNSTDCFDYDDSTVLFESDNLAEAHVFAHIQWCQSQNKAFTVIQPYDGCCRGGYGLTKEE